MSQTYNIIAQFNRWPHVKEKWVKSIMKIRKQAMEELAECERTKKQNTPRIPYTAQSFRNETYMQERLGFQTAPMKNPRSLVLTTKRKNVKLPKTSLIGG